MIERVNRAACNSVLKIGNATFSARQSDGKNQKGENRKKSEREEDRRRRTSRGKGLIGKTDNRK